MYNNKLAVALKSNGNVLREFGETVYVPFGSEYSVLIKNLNSVRALVTVTIDDTDAGDGTQFVVNPNDDLELERFITNGNMKKGNRFKFIERTDGVEQHRGIGIEDGLIRVEFQFEKPVVYFPNRWHYSDEVKYFVDPYRPREMWNNDSGNVSPDFQRGSIQCNDEGQAVNFSSTVAGSVTGDSFELTSQSVLSDVGITVPGSESDQKFSTVSSFPVESKTHVIVLQLLGQTEDNKVVTKAVTVKAKPECTTCGKKNKAKAKFCSECGTSLNII